MFQITCLCPLCVNQPGGLTYDCRPPSAACAARFAMLMRCSFSNRYPLRTAASNRHVSVVQLLLSCNASFPTCTPFASQSLLFMASLSSLLRIAHSCAHLSNCSLVPRVIVLRTYCVECHQASTAKLSSSPFLLSADRAPSRLFFQ